MEKYKPSPEEIKKAEDMMTPEEKKASEKRELELEKGEGAGVEQKPELEAIPIFRNNDLYAALFPEIKPALERGEEPTLKKVLEAVIQYKNKNIILDQTCHIPLYENASKSGVTLGDFPKEFELTELPTNKGYIDYFRIKELLKQKFNISVSVSTIDNKIDLVLEGTFSAESVEGLLNIAKQKNKNIKKIYIITKNISDHADRIDMDRSSIQDEIAQDDNKKRLVIEILVNGVKKEFGIEPIIVESKFDIEAGDHVIVDRHNTLACSGVIKEKPTQFTVLPLGTELLNNEEYIGNKPEKIKLVTMLRKQFEKKEENIK